MQNTLSDELFGRLSTLYNTLKLETIQFVNTVSSPNDEESDDSPSDESVILIDGPDEFENNQFIKILRNRQRCLTHLKSEILENLDKKLSKLTLEDMLNIGVSLHVQIDESIDLICKKLGIEPDQVQRFKSPLDDSIPVSLFQSKLKEMSFDKIIDRDLLSNNDIEYLHKHEDQNKSKESIPLNVVEDGLKINSLDKNIKKHKFSVNDMVSSSQEIKNIHMVDLNNLGLSDETKKLLGLE